MGTDYYFARPDNRTTFHMGKAYGLRSLIGCDDNERVDFRVLYLGLAEWHKGEDQDHIVALMAAISLFAESQPIYFVSEHHEWLDEDKPWRQVGSRWKVEGCP